MNILDALQKVGLVELDQRKLIERDEQWRNAVTPNAKYALVALCEGVLFYPQLRDAMQKAIVQRNTPAIQERIPERMRPLIEREAMKLGNEIPLPLLDGRYLKPKKPIAQGASQRFIAGWIARSGEKSLSSHWPARMESRRLVSMMRS